MDNHSYPSSPPAFECLLGVGAVDSFSAAAGHAFPDLKQWAARQQDWVLGHLAYDLTAETEGVAGAFPDPIGFPDAFFFRPVHLILLQKDSVRIGSVQEDPAVLWQQICATQPMLGQPMAAGGPAAPVPAAAANPAAPVPAAAAPAPPAESSTDPVPAADGRPAAPAPAPANPIQFTPRFTREEYLSTVEALRRHILRGDCYEINFCQEFFAQPAAIDPYATWWALSQASPNPFAAFYRLDDRYLLCASPERFLKKTGATLFSQPIKGTAPRQKQDPLSDRRGQEELYNSAKDRAENVMVVDLVRNDLSRICEPGSVRVSELFGIYPFPQVYQMISTIKGTILPGLDWTDAVR
ncbi:MAG TPA: chorismate-binding protein, partial [Puia sp.]